jgi:hypothetical protein
MFSKEPWVQSILFVLSDLLTVIAAQLLSNNVDATSFAVLLNGGGSSA